MIRRLFNSYFENIDLINDNIKKGIQILYLVISFVISAIFIFIPACLVVNMLNFEFFQVQGVILATICLFLLFNLTSLIDKFFIENNLKKKEIKLDGLFRNNFVIEIFAFFILSLFIMLYGFLLLRWLR